MLHIMIDGQRVSEERAVIPIMDHGFLFGDSIYEAIRTKRGKLFAARAHLQRLHHSADQLDIPIPWPDSLLMLELEEMVEGIEVDNALLRLIVTRGIGPLKLQPTQCHSPKRIVIATRLDVPEAKYYRDGIRIGLSPYRKPQLKHEGGNIKTGNKLEQILALKAVWAQGYFEALRLDFRGNVAECTSSNVFWVKDDNLITPSVGTGILKGVTRQLVIHTAQSLGVEVVEGLFGLGRLLAADEVFITSTSREILPVSEVVETKFAVGPVTRCLMQAFSEIEDPELAF